MNNELIFIIILFPFAFAGFFCLVSYLISFIGGWRQLSMVYPRKNLPVGRRFSWQTMKLGFSNYGSCITIHSSAEGLDLSVMFIFRVGHPPLFIPWSEFQEARARRFLWYKYVEIDIGSPKLVTLKFSEKAYLDYRDSF